MVAIEDALTGTEELEGEGGVLPEVATGEPPVATVEVNPPGERDLQVHELVCIRFRSVEFVARKFELAPQTVRNIVRQTRDKLAREQFELATRSRLGSIQLAYDRLGYLANLLTNAFLRSEKDTEFEHRSVTRSRSACGDPLPPKEKVWSTLHKARPQSRLIVEARKIIEKMLSLATEFKDRQEYEAEQAKLAAEVDAVWNDPEAEPIAVKRQSKRSREQERERQRAKQEANREAKRAAAEARAAERQRKAEEREQAELDEQREILARMLAMEPQLASRPEMIHAAKMLGVPLPYGDANVSDPSGRCKN